MCEEYFRLQLEIIKTMLNEMPDRKKIEILDDLEKIVTNHYISHRYCQKHINQNQDYKIKPEC